MIGTRMATLRLRGSGEHLRLRVGKAPDPLANVLECCRASVAVEKALGEAIRDALAADTIGLRWDTHSASTPARRPAWVNSTTLRAVPCGRSSGARAGRRAAERALMAPAGSTCYSL